jgi:hypothetical protein
MFEAGHFNEDAWCTVLEAGLPEGWSLLREEEIAIRWETDAGTPVTGRPDIVICDETGKPVKGLELKLSSAVWSARSAVLQGEPKFVHLAQSGHYAMKLDIPYEIWYTSRTNFTAEEWALGVMPQWGEPRSEHIEYTLGYQFQDGVFKSGKKKGQPKMKFKKVDVPLEDRTLSAIELEKVYGITHGRFKYIKPYHMGFALDWADDVLHYEPVDGSGPRVASPITQTGIHQFYNLLDDIQETGDLGPRPMDINSSGDTVNKFNPCTYCALQEICDSYDSHGDYDKWKDDIDGN